MWPAAMFESLGKLRVQPVCPQRTEFSRGTGSATVEGVAATWSGDAVVGVDMVKDAESGEFCVLQACMINLSLPGRSDLPKTASDGIAFL